VSHEPLPIGVRVFSEPDTGRNKRRARARADGDGEVRQPWVPPAHELVVVADVETTADCAQAMLVAGYRVFEIDWTGSDPAVSGLQEGLIHDNLGASRRREDRRLREYAAAHPPQVDRGRPDAWRALRLVERRDFVTELVIPCAVAGATLALFNAPFDLSRLAESWGFAQGDFYGGFRLSLADVSAKRRARSLAAVRTKRLTGKAFRLDGAVWDRGSSRWWQLRILDLHTLSAALCDRDYSLDGAAQAFGLRHRKLPKPQFGKVTFRLLDYLRRDVQVTADLYVAAMREFRRHSIGRDPCYVYSPAGIAAGYLDAAGFQPPLSRG
jgi:hypothetical protein